MNKKLKILFIPRWYPNRVDSLNGVFIKRHALAVAIKHKVAVLYINADPALKDTTHELEFAIEEGIATVRVYYNNSLPRIPFVSSVLKFYRYLSACKMGIKAIKEKFGTPDISHIHVLARTFLPAYYFKYFFNTPFIVSEQWSGYLPEDGMYKGFLKKMLTKIAIRKASAVTTVSESLKDAMRVHGLSNEYTVIPNVVDINKFFPADQKKDKHKFFLLTVADLDDRAKNLSGAIRVMQKLSESRNDFEYHIVGAGRDMDILQEMASKYKIVNKYVFFHGARNSDEVAEIMRKADLFVLFSNYDNMPTVMTEAFASGLPVVGSAVHGMKEHIKEGLGLLVEPGNENMLRSSINNALNNI
ncbi:MAG: glycosyltransferase, partial [Bacteroidetes bacterium]